MNNAKLETRKLLTILKTCVTHQGVRSEKLKCSKMGLDEFMEKSLQALGIHSLGFCTRMLQGGLVQGKLMGVNCLDHMDLRHTLQY